MSESIAKKTKIEPLTIYYYNFDSLSVSDITKRTLMPNFLGNVLNDFRKRKEGLYSEMGFPTQTHVGFFTPYKSVSDVSSDLAALPIKFWTCVLDTIIETFSSLGSLLASTYYFFICNPSNSAECLINSANSFATAIYMIVSAVTDTLASLLSLITRPCATLVSTFTNSCALKNDDNRESTENNEGLIAKVN